MEIFKIQKIAMIKESMMSYPYERFIPSSQMGEYNLLRQKNEELINKYLELLKIEDQENTSALSKTQETLDELHRIEAQIAEIAKEPKRRYEEEHKKALNEYNESKERTEQRYKTTPKLKRTLEQRVRKHFPVTDNVLSAGYMMSNGDLLSFSHGYGNRDKDHRAVSEAFEGLDIDDGTDGMIQFMRATGAIRLNLVLGYCDFDIEVKPNSVQFSKMMEIVRQLHASDITIDFKGESQEFKSDDLRGINKFLYKNADTETEIKTAGYIKAPEEITQWIENKIMPYIETAWASSKTKEYKVKIENLQKRMKWYLEDIQEYEQGNKGELTPQEAQRRITHIKSIVSEMPNHIKEIQNKILSLQELRTVKMGGIQNDITAFEIPKSLIRQFVKPFIIKDEDTGEEGKVYPSLGVQIRYRASHGAHYDEDTRTIVVGLYQLIQNREDTVIYDDNKLATLEKAKMNFHSAIEHELIHWLQDVKSINLNGAEYGNPSKSIQNPEATYEKYWESSPKKKEEIHPMIDSEFFPSLNDELVKLNNLFKSTEGRISIEQFIEANRLINKWKNTNTGKYQRAVKEIYKYYQQLKDESV